MKRSSRIKKQKKLFSFKRFFVMLIACVLAVGVWRYLNLEMPTSKELESSRVVSKPVIETSKVEEAAVEAAEINALETEIRTRQENAKAVFEADAGVLYVDESYGGSSTEREGEMPVAKFSIPALEMEREIWQGVGASENGVAGFGDNYRLYRAATYRADQTLGGDNFTVVSHIWNGENAFGKDFSNEWFSPLLTSTDGGMTTDLSKLKLQKGDKIIVEEFETGFVFEFEISELRAEVKATQDGQIAPEVKELLMARIDKPRITLQGCLMNTDKLFFVVGELKTISSGDNSWTFE